MNLKIICFQGEKMRSLVKKAALLSLAMSGSVAFRGNHQHHFFKKSQYALLRESLHLDIDAIETIYHVVHP